MQIMFGRKNKPKSVKSNSFIEPSPSLSSGFAQEVLDLEGELDFCCNIETIQRLLQLYTQAIEFFESIKDPKYLHYQERMQNLLARKDVLQVIKNPQGENRSVTPTPTLSTETFKKKAEQRQKMRVKQADVHLNKDVAIERNAEQTIITHASSNTMIKGKIKENLKLQADSLNMRLHERKSHCKTPSPDKLNRRSTIGEFTIRPELSPENEESDRSGGFCKKTPLELFEQEVESIMENFVEEKAKIKSRIMENYNEELREVTKMGDSPLLNDIKNQMKKVMEEELAEALAEVEKKRKQAIDNAKQKLLSSN
ncbi:unnamed protein product [Blepharisma stoltei]|uniref:Uncharacterized protein n=1 Tax=Blepharisma stoltei TaxID=1481888 RepID=A0AAU9J8F6_9CILI|nr:unnamed protein product [Blepharisma stoltei]